MTQEAVELELALAVDAIEYEVFKRYYQLDPAGMVQDCVDWDAARSRPMGYQLRSLDEMARFGRMSMRALRGAGKTAPAAWAILWFALTRDGVDWKCGTTAGSWSQLKLFLWPEVHKWARLLRWDKIGRAPLVTGRELLDMAIQLDTGEAFAVASNNPDRLEGLHGQSVLGVIDEGKIVPDRTYDAIEGWFSGAGGERHDEAFVLNYSTPGPPAGRFYAIQSRQPGYEDWRVMHVTAEEAVEAGQVSAEWVEGRRRQWGETSPVFRQQVLGEFASEEDSVIPLDWVEAAQERWRALAAGAPVPATVGEATSVGVDVGHGSGRDETVLAPRWGPVVPRLATDTSRDEMETAGRVVAELDSHGGTAVVDVIGIGAGVVARLRELKRAVMGFNGGESAGNLTDRSGKLGFANRRAAAWWGLRERLDPGMGDALALPPDDRLTADLVTPRYSYTSTGKILIESKEDIASRLGGRSTDRGDAVAMAFFTEAMRSLDAPQIRRARTRVL